MKKIKILSFIFILVFGLNISSQTESELLQIKEGESLNLCGHIIIVDGIWMNEGIIRADISILERPNSKPITGGYIKGDEFKLSEADSCKYYISSITKSGPDSGKGTVILSSSPPAEFLQICEDTLLWKGGIKNWFDTLDHKITSIRKEDDDKLTAMIEVTYKSVFIKKLELKKNDYIWAGECLYKVTAIAGETTISVGNKQEIESSHLVLARQNYYIHSSIEETKGLDNLPNITSKSYFVIRNAQLYRGMKPTKKEIENKGPQLWLIQIYYESRKGASRIMKVVREGKEIMVQFDPIRTFKDEDEALEYAKENSITDVKLEEEK